MKTLTLKSALLALTVVFTYATSLKAQSVYLNESTSQTIVYGNTSACGYSPSSTATSANSYYRAFKISDFITANYFNVDSVQFSVELANSNGAGLQPLNVNVYSLSGTNVTLANLTLLSSFNGYLPDVGSTGSVFTAAVPASIAGTGTIVVEVASPDGLSDGHSFYIGSNNLGQTKPSYWYAPSCGTTDITDLSTVGLANPMDILISVYGRGSSIAPPAMPGAFVNPVNPVCDNTTGITYSVPNVAGMSYNWIYTGTGVTSNVSSPVGANSVILDFASGATSGTLSVSAINANGVSQPRTLAITVNPSPVPGFVSQSGNVLSCPGNTYTSYAWYRNGVAIPSATNATYTMTQGGDYFLIGSDGGVCGANSDTVSIPNSPDAFINPVNPVCISSNSSISETYSVPAVPGIGFYYWNYTGLGVSIAPGANNNGNAAVVTFSSNATSGTLSVYYTTLNNMTPVTSVSRDLDITINPQPVPVISRGGSLLTATSGFASYAWYRNNLQITGATSNTYQMTQNGSYFVKVTNASGCSGNSDTFQIDDVTTGIVNVGNAQLAFNLYPNPAQENVTLTIENNMGGSVATTVTITDISGRTVASKVLKLSSGKQLVQMNTTELKAGIYFVNLSMGDKRGIQKLVIVK